MVENGRHDMLEYLTSLALVGIEYPTQVGRPFIQKDEKQTKDWCDGIHPERRKSKGLWRDGDSRPALHHGTLCEGVTGLCGQIIKRMGKGGPVAPATVWYR